jgi:two-component system, LytTR family, sensor kinase
MESDYRSHIIELWRKRWVRILFYIALWTCFALLYAIQLYLVYGNRSDVRALTWDQALTREFSYWSVWAVLTPLIFFLSNKFRIGYNNWIRNIPFHIIAAMLFAIIHFLIYITLIWLFDPPILMIFSDRGADSFLTNLTRSIVIMNFNTRYIIYWIILFLSHAIYYYKRFREGERIAMELRTELAEAHLHVLKFQLHPHFLFNTLNSISSLMHTNSALADKMITKLSDFLRLTLTKVGLQEVTLKEELDILQNYLDIEQIRFGNRLKIQYDIHHSVYDALVPNLILQPIVENAITHGIADRHEGGEILIRALPQNGQLLIQVTDTGKGIHGTSLNGYHAGIGLKNTRARLQQLYGGDYNLVLSRTNDSGSTVSIRIPHHSNELHDL